MTEPEKPTLTITVNDIKKIKDAALKHFHGVLPRNLDSNELMTLMICKGFVEHLGYKGIKIPVKIEYDWEKNISR